MKTIARTFAFAIAIMGLTVACHNNKPAEEPADTTNQDTVTEVIDTNPAPVVENVQAPAPKPAAPKAEAKKVEEPAPAAPAPKTEIKANEDGSVSIKAGKGTAVEVNKGGATVTTSDGKVKATKKK